MQPRDIALAVAVTAAWGFNYVMSKTGLRDMPPLLFSALRYVLAASPLLILGVRRGPPVAWRYVVGIGLTLGVFSFTLLFAGMAAGLPASQASLVFQSQAFFTALFAALLGDRLGRRPIAGMALAFAGIALIGLTTPMDTAADGLAGPLAGFGMVLAGAAFWGVANIIMKAARAPDPMGLMVWSSLIPPLPLLALSFWLEGPDRMAAALAGLSWRTVGALAYIAFVATLFGFAAWGRLLRMYPAGLVAAFSLLVPIVAVAAGVLVLGEPLTPPFLAGGALVLAGLGITVWPR